MPAGFFRYRADIRCAAFLLLLLAAVARADVTDIEGRWLTENKEGWIRLEVVGGTLEGRIAGAPPGSPGKREFDDRNPDPALRKRRLKDLVIMTGFTYVGEGRWKNGTVYDPNSGKTYKCTARLLDANTLVFKGYVVIPLFGRSETWTRDDPGPHSD